MPKAGNVPTTPCRSPLAMSDGRTATQGVARSAEAEIIWLCDQMVQLDESKKALLAIRHTAEDEAATAPILDRLYGIENEIYCRILEIPDATTPEAGRALLRAAETQVERERDGSPAYRSNAECLAFRAAHALAGRPGGVASDSPGSMEREKQRSLPETDDISITPGSAAPDPLVALCQQIRDFDAAQDPIDAKASELRAVLTARYGAPTKWRAADDLWDGDPLLIELKRLNIESDERTGRILALTDQVKKTPAATSAGLLAKLRLAISLFPRPMLNGEHDLHETFAQATLKDAAGLLERETAGETDAELISNCAEMVTIEHEWQNAGNDDGEYPDRPKRWDDLLDKVTETEAVTEAGRRAKLSVAVAFFEPDGPDYRSVVDELLWHAVEALAMPAATLKRFAPAEAGA